MAVTAAARLAALAPPCAYGEPAAQGALRATPEDFVVEEDLGFAPAGAGAHLLLKVRKRAANTQWVAKALARIAGCRPMDVGYAGLKDRQAVALQWFSVPRPRATVAWEGVRTDEFEVLEAHAHNRKLPRGALAGNRFTLRINALAGSGEQLAVRLRDRLALIGAGGVPNYFGPQRFGRDGANLERAQHGWAGLRGEERGFVLSAARSVIFNAVLAARVADGGWRELRAGDLANLDARGSIFAIPLVDEVLQGRCTRLEIHPTGPLWGAGEPATSGAVLELEAQAAAGLADYSQLCLAARLEQERRSLRLAVRELTCESQAAAVVLRFRLTRGAFATAVLRELVAGAAAD